MLKILLKSHLLNTLGSTDLILIGNFNGRVGILQNIFSSGFDLYLQVVRNSKDKISDNKGARILELADAFDCRILNGSCEGDPHGEYTFLFETACSVIDYYFLSRFWISTLSEFRVAMKTFSGHMPFEVTLKISCPSNTVNLSQLGLLPKLTWKDGFRYLYQQNLNAGLIRLSESNTPPSTELLTEIIKRAAPRSTLMGDSTRVKKQKWFDKECMKARDASFAFLRLLRSSDSASFKVLYAAANKYFKHFCFPKKTTLQSAKHRHIKWSEILSRILEGREAYKWKEKCYRPKLW